MFVVISGILRVTYTDPQDIVQEYYLASGLPNLVSLYNGQIEICS